MDLLEHKSIFTAGYKCILHIHSLVEECEAVKLIYSIDLKTKEQKKVTDESFEHFKDCKALHSFTLPLYYKFEQRTKIFVREEGGRNALSLLSSACIPRL